MNRRDLLEHFTQWVVVHGYDDVLHDTECRVDVLAEYIEENPDNMEDPVVAVPTAHRPDRTRKAAAKGQKDARWTKFVSQCEDALPDIELLPDACRARDGWYEKVFGMQQWAEEHEHVTDAMLASLNSILEGASKWE